MCTHATAPGPLLPPDLPEGFPAHGLQVYDAEEDDYLFTFGHVTPDQMTAAVAEYIRHIHFPPDAVVDDPLATLVGGAERVRATICYGYATYDPRPTGFCSFSADLFVDPTTEGALPITYWPGEFG
ncbi:hypothetical protein [Nonomuraea sp. NPDC049141]|uniref:hypothetical protein n=1 Tax=Nonomuraea sp. NPDC049141 TaxID=3155500 RepID=UPI0033E2BB05